MGFNGCFMLNLAPALFRVQRLYIFISLNVPPKGAKKERKENPDLLVKKKIKENKSDHQKGKKEDDVL